MKHVEDMLELFAPANTPKKKPVMQIPNTAIDVSPADPATVPADWLVVGVWANEPFSGPAATLDTATGGLLSKLREAGDLTGKHLELIPVLNPTGIAAKRLLVVGLGKPDAATRATVHDAASAAARHITGKKLGTIAFAVPSPEFTLAAGVGLAQGCQGPGHSQDNANPLRTRTIVAHRRRRNRPPPRAGRGAGVVAGPRTGERPALRPVPGNVRRGRCREWPHARLRGGNLGRSATRGRRDGIAPRGGSRFHSPRSARHPAVHRQPPAARPSAWSARV